MGRFSRAQRRLSSSKGLQGEERVLVALWGKRFTSELVLSAQGLSERATQACPPTSFVLVLL